jgi:hypothetical protein
MAPDPMTPAGHASRSETLLSRVLGGMSVFALDGSAGSDHLGRPPRCRRFRNFVECLSPLRFSLALVWTAEARQEHLLAVCRVGWPGYGSNRWRCYLRMMNVTETPDSKCSGSRFAAAD